MADNPIAMQQKELNELRANMNLQVLNISRNSLVSMGNLLHRMDAIDNAIAMKLDLDNASLKELLDVSRQTNESTRLRLDILRSVNGYNTDTSKVEVEETESTLDTTFSEEDAERLKAELEKRNGKIQDAEIVP
jgi:Na+/phosphate symporter